MLKRRKTFTILTMVTLNILFSTIGHSQEKKIRGYRVYSIYEVSNMDIKKLNTILKTKGYSQFSNNIFGFGGSYHVLFKKIVLDAEGYGFFTGNKKSTVANIKYQTSLNGGYIIFNAGYLVYEKGGVNIFPLVGLGAGGMTLHKTERAVRSFDDNIDSSRSISVSKAMIILNLALEADKLFINNNRYCPFGSGIGVRIGYRYSPVQFDWKVVGIDVDGGPDVSFTGPYFRVMFGFGGRNK